MRDEASDRKSNKNTIVVKIGGAKAKIYHYILIVRMVLVLILQLLMILLLINTCFLLAYIPLTKHLITVYKKSNPRN
jgi:1,4-dihydroxy-2-naphthoate octaprenyltransferase